MTDNDKPHDETIPTGDDDAENPEVTESGETNPENTGEPAPRARGAGVALFIALLGLLGALGVGAGGYYLWQTQQQLADEQRQQLTALEETLTGLRRQHSNQNSRQDDQLQQLQTRQQNLDDALQTLIKSRSHLRNDWLLTEAEYLLKLANHRLLLERDVATAIVALQSADERLHEVADPGLLKIRQRIAADINDLRAVNQPDLAGLSFTLSSLAGDIPRLPLATPDPQTRQQLDAAASQSDKVETWRELPTALWQDLKSLVVIRQHDEPIQPLLAPEQRFFLTQNLQLQLEQARLALLNGQTRVYRERLQQARQWVETYFDTEQAPTRQTLEQLDQLAEQEIHPALPDISDTHQALERFRQQRRLDDKSPSQGSDTPTDTTESADS
ncbi:MAG: uroporphyrinogen-III C-methyltransferase [Thiohalophilus sp.]|uniref:uroporphyrinogen-III C-methyltransferase n=1 Tax=Thiohalophilus sp. TaxID=3028392 RepID=UPI00286FB48D|nr:uroporphyrinogen-III C-methyltransferase [Thiohalophilus sp.]MDR9437186.1 uroporphyrinogen-III C-methyltransferase [Thiohalophilus sp.]